MKWEGGRGEEQMSQNGTGWSFFFFFQYQKKWQSKCSFVARSSSILHLDVCAQTLTHTHSDAITCTFNSDKRTEHDCDVFYNCFSENVLHLFSRWRTPHKRIKKQKNKTMNKNIKKWIAQKNIYNIFKKEEVKSNPPHPSPVNPWFLLFKVVILPQIHRLNLK